MFGAYGFDLDDGTRYVIHADAVILASGGHTRIWRHSSSRRDENTGDSFRLAIGAGARIRDAELVQFHPSGLIQPENAAGTLVSEAARGEGACSATGSASGSWPGMTRSGWSSRRGTGSRSRSTPRSRRVEARRTGVSGSTSLTSRADDPEPASPRPRDSPRAALLDVTTTPIEVAPTAHYSMGGVWVDPQDNRTGVQGLYAVGEAASGMHGANRLGGNSLAELIVYGRIVGEAAASYSANLPAQQRSADAVARRLPRPINSSPPTDPRTCGRCNALFGT